MDTRAAQDQADINSHSFRSAVAPTERTPDADAARRAQKEQFLLRQGFEKVDPVTRMTASQERAMSPAQRLVAADMVAKNNIATRTLDQTGSQFDKTQQHDLTRDSNKAKNEMLMADKNRDYLTSSSALEREARLKESLVGDNRKLAQSFLLNGRGGPEVERLYNSDGSFGNQPQIGAIKPITPKTEMPLLGAAQVKDIKTPDGNTRSMLLDARTGSLQTINPPDYVPKEGAPAAKPAIKPKIQELDPEEVSFAQSMIGAANTTEEAARYLASVRRDRPDLFERLYNQHNSQPTQ